MGFNTLYHDIQCPHCDKVSTSGIGFQVGSIKQADYKIGDSLSWEGAPTRPQTRPTDGNLQTIGYFNCDNPSCKTWEDCFPQIQEALITIENDVITSVKVTTHKPGSEAFDILEPSGLV